MQRPEIYQISQLNNALCLYWLHIIYNARNNKWVIPTGNSTKQKIKINHTSYIYAKIQSDLPKHDYLSCLPWSRPSRGPSVSASLFGPNTDVWNLEITKKNAWCNILISLANFNKISILYFCFANNLFLYLYPTSTFLFILPSIKKYLYFQFQLHLPISHQHFSLYHPYPYPISYFYHFSIFPLLLSPYSSTPLLLPLPSLPNLWGWFIGNYNTSVTVVKPTSSAFWFINETL